ncbi:TetR/AcrR family transcriptional regulator [Propionibacteriaceae bacterium Y2011]
MARKLNRDDWAREALTVIGESGLGAVAVEPLATRLGATKGSFYWHFADRAAVVDAAIALWEHDHTEGIITAVEQSRESGDTPQQRLRRLLDRVIGDHDGDRIELALLASADDPRVAPAMQRTTERRIAYVTTLYEEMGLESGEARARAVIAVSVYLGHLQLRYGSAVLPSGAAGRRHLDLVARVLIAEAGPATR